MNLKDYVAISGQSGLFKVLSTRPNGMFVEDLDHGKSRFFSVRKHQFTPLESVAIYTDDDTIALDKIFGEIKRQIDKNPLPLPPATSPEFFSYFESIVPDYDRERVMISDIKKVIKWFRFLDNRSLLEESSDEEE